MALIGAHLAVGGSLGVYEGIGLGSAGVIALATAAYRPPNRLGWYGVACAQALFAAGDLVYFHLDRDGTFPGPADAFYVASYGVYIAALLALMGRRFPWRDWGGHLDAALVAAALGFVFWMLVVDESFEPSWTWAGLVSFFYPLADLVLLGLMLRILLAPGRRPIAYWLLLVALLPLLASDGSYVVPALASTYSFGSWLDAGWLASYLLIAAAALDPSMRRVAAAKGEPRVATVRRVAIGAVAMVALPLAAVFDYLVRGESDLQLLLVASLFVVTGMGGRAVLLVRALDEQRRRAEESERRFRLVFERAPIGISVGRDGIMSDTNPALHRLLGYSREEFARLHYTQVTHPDDRSLDVQAELDAGKRDTFSVDKRYVAKDGTVVDAHVRVALDVLDGLGISLIEDVRERRALEEQLRQAQKLEAVGKLAGGVAHDFNNLMTGVLGYSDLVLKRLEPDDVNREKLEAIREAAIRAGELTRQLLAFGRRQVLLAADIDLCELVAGLAELLPGADLRVETTVESVPVVVRADRSQLEQVVLNLAANARDAMPAGGTLRLGVAAEPPWAVLMVADTGAGMDAHTSGRIFEPFFTTKPVGEGSGLGLATVHGIVGQSGGTIDVATAPGAGSVFTVCLPLAVEPALPRPGTRATLLTD